MKHLSLNSTRSTCNQAQGDFVPLPSKICDWPALIQNYYFIGPYNLHHLLFSGIGALLCHHLYCSLSQSQTLSGIGAGQPEIWPGADIGFCSPQASSLGHSGGRTGKGRRACNYIAGIWISTSKQNQCKMLIGRDDISNDIITLGTLFFNVCLHSH